MSGAYSYPGQRPSVSIHAIEIFSKGEEGMSLRIYVAFTGACLRADPISFTSTEALRSWISNHAGIPPQQQILMTAKGKNVKQQHLLTETEVFVYDKQYVSVDDEQKILPLLTVPPSPPPFRAAPKTIADQNTLQSWRNLFMGRRSWALELTEIANDGKESAISALEETHVIERSTAVALGNLKNHVGSIQHKFEGTRNWAREMLNEHESTLNDWQQSLDVLRKMPARRDFNFLLKRPLTPTENGNANTTQSEGGTLDEFIDIQAIGDAANDLTVASDSFAKGIQNIEQTMRDLGSDTLSLDESQQRRPLPQDEVSHLFEEAEALAKKINSDYEEVLRLPDNSKSIATASRRALIHTRDFLPHLATILNEINQATAVAINCRNDAVQNSVKVLREISIIESRLPGLQSQIAGLDMDPQGIEALEIVSTVFQLPIAYGSTLVEAIRRTEWTEMMKTESNLLKEEMNMLQEDEHRRRKKWAKSIGGLLLEDPDDTTLGIAVNLSKGSRDWPVVTREEIFKYVDQLNQHGIDDAVQYVTQLLKELEQPIKSRKRIGKAFKHGSVYEARFGQGRSSLLFRDDEDSLKALRDEKLKLEDKLKASDSRVRKLEDLLHRQSQMARPLSGNFGPASDLERQATSPNPILSPRPNEFLSRRSSASSRRLSSNQNNEEKVLIQRIVSLEAEVARLQREAHAERRSSTETRDKMQEVESTKRDLMANFEAQKQEFDDERQLLEDETHKLKIRLEEAEDELDRVLGSRDHQKLTSDRLIEELRLELERLRTTSAADLAREKNRADSLQNENTHHREIALSADRQLQQLKEERGSIQSQNVNLANQLREAESERQEFISSLQVAHAHLSPEGSAPEELPRLVKAIEVLSEGFAIHTRGLEDTLNLSVAEQRSLEEKIAQLEVNVKQMEEKLLSARADSISIRDELAKEQNKLKSLRSELADEQEQLKILRAKFAAGETGSEALKERVAEEERKVGELTEKLAVATSNGHSLEQEVGMWKTRLQDMTTKKSTLESRLERRASRAKELSQRLFSHNDRMIRMLEQVGFSVTLQDEKLIIQRATKTSASTTLSGIASATEISSSMKRTISSNSPVEHYSNTSDLDSLYWMSGSDEMAEDLKFQAFLSALGRLDVDAAVDLITKRYKDVETSAKKYQRESRAYREKSHRLQSEAHDKIAYRGFKEGDLALFLPTRDQARRPWAAFNVGAPHFFLREQDGHKLQTRDWLLARISKVEERVVDLSRSLTSGQRNQVDRRSINTEASDGASTRSFEEENPFELSDGLRWYMIDAYEEKPGAPSTPGLGKSTVASSNVEVKGSIRLTKEGKKPRDVVGNSNAVLAAKTLSKSLDSRRSSSGSKKGLPASPSANAAGLLPATEEALVAGKPVVVGPTKADDPSGKEAREDAEVFEQGGDMRSAGDDVSSPTRGVGLGLGLGDQGSEGQSKVNVSRAKQSSSPERAAKKPWERLWSIDYRLESGSK